MENLTDIQIGSNDLFLKNNRIKSSVIPQNSKELKRKIVIQGNVIAEGPIYAEKLEVENGPAKFLKSVFAESELYILATSKSAVYFQEACGSSHKISALLTSGKAIFGADINAPEVSLKNCFVAGSIFAKKVSLENSIVLGGVFASKELSLKNSMVGLFNAAQASAEGMNYLLYPTSFSVEPIQLVSGTVFKNLCLADLGSLFKGEEQKPGTGSIPMDLETEGQYITLVDKDGAQYVINSYSVAAKVVVADLLSAGKFENHFLITAASLGPQLLKAYSLTKENGETSSPLDLEHIVPFFFEILSGKRNISELDAKVPFEDLKDKMIDE